MINISENINLDNAAAESINNNSGNSKIIGPFHPTGPGPVGQRKWYYNQVWNTSGGTGTGSVGVGSHDSIYVQNDLNEPSPFTAIGSIAVN